MSPVNSLWFKWKSLRLPWRSSFLVGTDLSGNTFWEFKDHLNAGRYRRIVKCDPKTHFSDVQVSPQWHQWLRYVRAEAPTLEEQQQDIIRQIQIKELARLADARWASKPSYLDMPNTQRPLPTTNTSGATLSSPETQNKVPEQQAPKKAAPPKEDPWAKARAGGPSENWQPQSWSPPSSKK
ncbi:hypothetical protein BO70DRAFT_332112 [Aspergillus heteromorphus CBS 117.55]|uniref:Uncharacterized protein n=1 Tax=Aspergillus heteromorphus CBS 117.55 TaxID=1448321 RepID=A0A317WQ72_9EURO|nr:uncharacterized protein BO70DRAFT_332112 [Aspergillus heteromorphus CBS 117.55]PWY88546.1 hypothetical protein BO70DRAFT_332112 [Aspergillus heteromorphus CBS 117.55]